MPVEKRKKFNFKNLDELNKYADKINVDIKNHKQCNDYCKSVVNIYKKANNCYDSADEENAYILYMRCFTILRKIRASYEFNKQKAVFEPMLTQCNAKIIITRLEQLNKILEKKYTQLIEAEAFEKKYLKRNLSEKKAPSSMISLEDELILPEVPTNVPTNKPSTKPDSNRPKSDDATAPPPADTSVTDSEPQKRYPTREFISVTEFYEVLKEHKDVLDEILIVDLRPTDEFSDAHIKHGCTINISKNILQYGANVNTVDRLLDAATWEIWSSRYDKRFVAVMDYETKEINAVEGSAIMNLVDILCALEGNYKVLVMDGGFQQWHLHYPSMSTNPAYTKESTIKFEEPSAILNGLSYPKLPQTETLNDKPEAISNSPEKTLPKIDKFAELRKLLDNSSNELDDIVVPSNQVKKVVSADTFHMNDPGAILGKKKGDSVGVVKKNDTVVEERNFPQQDNRSTVQVKPPVVRTNMELVNNRTDVPHENKKEEVLNAVVSKEKETNELPEKSKVVDQPIIESKAVDQPITIVPQIAKDNNTPSKPTNGDASLVLPKLPTPALLPEAASPPVLSKKPPATAPTPAPPNPVIQGVLPQDNSTPNQVKNYIPALPNSSDSRAQTSTPKPQNVVASTANPTPPNTSFIERQAPRTTPSMQAPVQLNNQEMQPTSKRKSPKKFVTTFGLPYGWEKAINHETGRIYYKNHNNQTTHWELPLELQREMSKKEVVSETPVNFFEKTPAHNKSKPLQPTVNDEAPKRPNLKRTLSSPNLAEDLCLIRDKKAPQKPAIDRSVKPKETKQLLVDRSTKPVSATRLHTLSPVYGSKGRCLTGLKNLGNTCYMNSVIQCLVSTAPLSKYFTSGMYEKYLKAKNMNARPGELARELAFLTIILTGGEYCSVSPVDFKLALGRFAPDFSGYEQQDAHELLMFFMDGLHEDVNKVTSKQTIKERDTDNVPDSIAAQLAWKDYRLNNDSIVVDLFQGQFRSTVTCLSCSHRSKTFDAFNCLQLQLPSNQSANLVNCIKSFTKPEKIGGNNSWKCSKCNQYREASKTIEIWKLPPVLIIQLKRFRFDGRWHNKIQSAVNFPTQNLNMTEHVVAPDTAFTDYHLYGVINHYGSFESGHYTAYCENPYYGKWYSYDDSIVKDMDRSSAKTNAAYLLFYTAVNFKESLN